MPFGKHKGTLIKELPGDYLKWLSTIQLHGPLRAAVQAALSWKVAPAAAGVAGSTPAALTSQEGACSASQGHSEAVPRASQHRGEAKPKRAWTPRAGDGYVDPAYVESRRAAQAADGSDIPW